MIEVKVSFATVDEMVKFFSVPQAIPLPTPSGVVHVMTDVLPVTLPVGMTGAEAEKAVRDAAANKADDEARQKLQDDRNSGNWPAALTEAPKKRGRKPKAEAETEPEGQQKVTEEPTAAPEAKVESAVSSGPTLDDVRRAAQAVVEKMGNEKGMASARKVLESAGGVRVIRDVPTDKIATVVEGLKELLK